MEEDPRIDRFKKVLAEKRELVWKEIEKYLPGKTLPAFKGDLIDKYRDIDALHWRMVREYPERKGKYGRPALVLLTYEAMAGRVTPSVVKVAAAMQTSEDWILIHDDLEDASSLRRERPALHKMHSLEMAVNAGDALHIINWKMILDLLEEGAMGEKEGRGADARTAQRLAREFWNMLSRTVVGQTAELYWTRHDRLEMTDEDIFHILDGKTVYYTIAGPMRLGAIMAGASEEQLDTLFEIGVPLGRAFQIRDDLLNLTSSEARYGKAIAEDLLEGKRTIPLSHFFRTTKKSDQTAWKRGRKYFDELQAYKSAHAHDRISSEDEYKDYYNGKRETILAFRDLIAEKGSMEYAEDMVMKFYDQAQHLFESKATFLRECKAKDHLRDGMYFMCFRDR